MAKYSSDSDSDRSSSRLRKKHSRRSSSIDSSDSSSSRQRRSKYLKSKRRYRSRSRSRDKDRASKSYKRSSDNSRDKRKNRSHRSRSSSAERKSKRRSASRDKSTSRSSSSQSNVKVPHSDKPSTSLLRENFLTNTSKIKASVLDDINNDEFVPRSFTSSAKDKAREKQSKMKNIVIDMTGDTIHVPQIANSSEMASSIFHTSIIAETEAKFDRWVKKLYHLRQKAMNDIV